MSEHDQQDSIAAAMHRFWAEQDRGILSNFAKRPPITVKVKLPPSGYTRVGDLVKSLEPEIKRRMAEAIDEALEDKPHYAPIYFEDLTSEAWEDRARAAGMTDAEMKRAKAKARQSGAPLVIDGKASEVSDE